MMLSTVSRNPCPTTMAGTERRVSTTTLRRIGRLLGLGAGLMCAALAACTTGERPLRLGTTHTVEQSGALAVLDSLAHPVPATVIGPSGQILAAAARGDLDVVITHAPSLERRLLVEPGHVLLACPFVASRFAIVGPPADPARVAAAPRAAPRGPPPRPPAPAGPAGRGRAGRRRGGAGRADRPARALGAPARGGAGPMGRGPPPPAAGRGAGRAGGAGGPRARRVP